MKTRYLIAVLIVSCIATVAKAEDAVVVASTVKSYSPGLVIVEGTPLDIPAEQNAIVLFRSGAMIRINGPFNRPLEVASSNVNSIVVMVQALRSSGTDASVIGASRAIPSAKNAMQAQRILIEPFHSAIYCIGESDSVWLVRQRPSANIVRFRKGEVVSTVNWTGNEVEWPADIEIEDGDQIETLGAANADPVATLLFHRLGAEPSEMAWLADSLLLGCREQAASALRELSVQLSKG